VLTHSVQVLADPEHFEQGFVQDRQLSEDKYFPSGQDVQAPAVLQVLQPVLHDNMQVLEVV